MTYRDWRKSTANKLSYWYAKHCVLAPSVYYINIGLVLECRNIPTSQVTI